MPDFHQGDSLPISFLDNVEPPLKTQETLSVVDKAKNAAIVPATLGPWLVKHHEGVSRPLIDGFVNTVRMIPGTDKVGAIGFCWGGRYAILQAHGQSKSGQGSSIGGVDAAYAVRQSPNSRFHSRCCVSIMRDTLTCGGYLLDLPRQDSVHKSPSVVYLSRKWNTDS